jgi:hypothetical protein
MDRARLQRWRPGSFLTQQIPAKVSGNSSPGGLAFIMHHQQPRMEGLIAAARWAAF